MKKLLLSIATVVWSLAAMAEGYQVNNLSSRQNGMGHVGTAMKLGSESLWFNPAAAAFQQSKFDISFGITGIASKATYTSLPDYQDGDLYHHVSDNKISTPLYFYANYKPTEWMSVGVAFNTPFGSSVTWGNDWAGAHLIQDINLAAYNFQPTVSFRIGKHLSIGAGLMVTWGNFSLSKSLLPVGAETNNTLNMLAGQLNPALAGVPLFDAAGDRAIASVDLEGKAKAGIGANIGIMWDINEHWSLGFTYRSQIKMKVNDGSIGLRLIDNPQIAAVVAQALPAVMNGLTPDIIAASKISTELPLPGSLTWGASFRPTDKWEFAIDLQYVLWSAYDRLNVDLILPTGTTAPLQQSEKNYSNTLAFRFGGQYHATEWLTARMGMYVDESPVSSDYLNPETPSMTKLAYTAGLSLRPAKFCSIDVAYGFVNSADPERTGSTPFTNLITGSTTAFSGNYKARAHTFSIGACFTF